MASTLWIGTRKGLFALRPDSRRHGWKLTGPQFLGHIVHHVVQDPRDPRRLTMAAKTGHLGPTVYFSGDRGRSWKEAAVPPAFRKAKVGGHPSRVRGTRAPLRQEYFAPKITAPSGRRWQVSMIIR